MNDTSSPGSSPRQQFPWAMLIALSIIATIAYFYGEFLLGDREIDKLCAMDGGERVHETVNVAGYVIERDGLPGYGQCYECSWYLPNRLFKYIDASPKEIDWIYGTKAMQVERYTMAKVGDPHILMSEEIIERLSDHYQIATRRNYTFISRFNDILGFASGQGPYSSFCFEPGRTKFGDLRLGVLKDSTKPLTLSPHP